MSDTPTLSERFKAALGTAVWGAPVSFLFWMVLNLLFKSSGGIEMSWVAAGIVLFALIGFLSPRGLGQKLKF